MTVLANGSSTEAQTTIRFYPLHHVVCGLHVVHCLFDLRVHHIRLKVLVRPQGSYGLESVKHLRDTFDLWTEIAAV